MKRANAVFALVVVCSAVVGATAAADFGAEVDTVGNVLPVVRAEVTTDVEAVRVVDQSLRVVVHLENPTGYDVAVTGATFRLFNGTEARLAGGPATRLDDGPQVLPANGDLDARYAVPLTPSQDRRVRSALRGEGARLTGKFAAVVSGEQFTIAVEPRHVDRTGES